MLGTPSPKRFDYNTHQQNQVKELKKEEGKNLYPKRPASALALSVLINLYTGRYCNIKYYDLLVETINKKL
jgi:hypothetical protein